MKKIFILALLIFVGLGFQGCDIIDFKDPPPICGCAMPYRLKIHIEFTKIENPNIKTITIEFRNIDNLKRGYGPIFGLSGLKSVIKRGKIKLEYLGGKEVAFWYHNIRIGTPLLDVDRIFELKIYMNADLFLTKKITFRTTENDTDYYTEKVEVDNRDYVKKINVGYENRKLIALYIEITDADVKSFYSK